MSDKTPNLASPAREEPANGSGPAPKTSLRRRLVVVLGVAIVFGALFAVGLVPRVRAQRALVASSQLVTLPTVTVFPAVRSTAAGEITLPGDVQANQETGIYARATGYVKRWTVDIGDHVEAGQVLAELETPELDQELAQGRAALSQASANRDLAASNLKRWKALSEQKVVSVQEYEERASAAEARAADVLAAQANVQRLEQLAGYRNIAAPFAGTITARSIDVGTLVNAGGGKELFHLAQTQPLRVFVDVPQTQMRSIGAGQTAQVSVREFPGRVFSGKVTRLAGALDRSSRTLRTEVQIDNASGDLLPGVHADVNLKLGAVDLPFLVPATAIIIRNGPPVIATVDANDVVKLQEIVLGRDLGAQIEVLAGLTEGARVIATPTDTLRNGDRVQVSARRS